MVASAAAPSSLICLLLHRVCVVLSVCSLFCDGAISVLSSFVIILLRRIALVVLL